jgi:hypothetical protein
MHPWTNRLAPPLIIEKIDDSGQIGPVGSGSINGG